MTSQEPGAGAAATWAPLVSGRHIEEAAEFLDEHPGPLELPADHPLVGRLAFVLAQRGRMGQAVELATSLRGLDLDVMGMTDAAQVQHLADAAQARVWVSWLEHRPDDEAVAAARRLLATDAVLPLDPARRATLHFSLAAALMGRSGDPQLLDDCADHLGAARSQATMLGYLPLEVASLARLALLHVPGGDVETARRLATAALTKGESLNGDGTAGATAAAYWRFISTTVEQWARYYQGLSMSSEAVAAIDGWMPQFAFDPVAGTVAGTVVALNHAQLGRVQQARSTLNALLAERSFAELGVWRVRPMVTDAYLAVASGDDSRARDRVADLTQAGAPGEALLIRATLLVAAADNAGALTALAGVTRGQVRATGLTFPVACALEALLLEQSGQSALADQSLRQAVGAAEPYAARRLFALHDPPLMVRLLQRAVAERPGDRWAQDILTFLDGEQGPGDRPATIAVHDTAQQTAASDAGSPDPDVTLSNPSPLTGREIQVLALVNQGASQAQMARELYVSLNTVKTHLRSIRQKLGVERTGEAAAVARSAGWLDG